MRTRLTLPLLLLIATAMGVASCSEAPADELTALHAKVDSLKLAREDLNDQIAALEAQILEIDPEAALNRKQVEVFTPTPGEFRATFAAQGEVASDKNVLMMSEYMGVVSKVYVKEGQRVSQGQTLISLTSEDVGAQVSQLKAQLDLAQAVFERQERLWKQNIGTELQFLQAKANRDQAQSALRATQAQQGKSVIRAPFSGTVDDIVAKEGEMAGIGAPLVRVVNLSNVYIEAQVSEDYLGRIKVGDSVTVEVPSAGQSFRAKATQVGQYIDPTNRTFKVRADLPKGVSLKPNQIATMQLTTLEVDSAFSVPEKYVLADDLGEYVYLVKKEGGAMVTEKRYLKTGPTDAMGNVLVLDGLKGGEKVVLKGGSKVVAGEQVNVVQ